MGVATDRLVGLSLLLTSGLIFVYYTIWVIILPFVDDDHVIHTYFLPRLYAVAVPVALMIAVALGIGCFVLVIIFRKKSPKLKSS